MFVYFFANGKNFEKIPYYKNLKIDDVYTEKEILFQATKSICNKPKFNPFNKISMKYLSWHEEKWSSKHSLCNSTESEDQLFEIIYNSNFKENKHEFYKIKLNKELFGLKFQLKSEDIKCYAQQFDKKIRKDLNIVNYGSIYMFNDEIVVNQSGFYHLSCFKEGDKKIKVYENVYSILPYEFSQLPNRELSKRKEELFMRSNKNKFKTLLNDFNLDSVCNMNNIGASMDLQGSQSNVLILMFDSVSYYHFQRVFPKTYTFLREYLDSNVIFENFNTIGENTYPNLISAMTGLLTETNEDLDLEKEIDYIYDLDDKFHDNLPFVWKNYEQQNYLTMFNEDYQSIGVFNFVRKGFKNWPVGYFLTPYWLKHEQIRSGLLFCNYGEPLYRKFFNDLNSFVNHLNNFPQNKPYFSFNFIKSYTHDYLYVPPNLDLKLYNMLKQFEDKGYLDDTLLVLMSDHGSRVTLYSFETDQGRNERTWPFLSIRLPKRLRNTQYAKNLLNNKRKFISHFDFYKTLRHFSYLNVYDQTNSRNDQVNSEKCRTNFQNSDFYERSLRGVSLFEDIPKKRSCSDAMVPNIFCSCSNKEKISEEKFLKETNLTFRNAGLVILNQINLMTEQLRSYCSLFSLRKVISVKSFQLNDFVLYELKLLFSPADAVFLGYLKANFKNPSDIKVYQKAIRFNRYGNQSNCINRKKLFGYCYCKK